MRRKRKLGEVLTGYIQKSYYDWIQNKKLDKTTMPYYKKKNRYSRGRYYKRRYYRGKGRSTRSTKITTMMKQMELKTHDKYIDYANIDTTGEMIPLSAIADGTERSEREGLKITGKTLYAKVNIGNDVDQTVPTVLRMIVFRDTSNLVTDPTPAKLLQVVSYIGLFSVVNRVRFRIMYDNTFVLGADTGEDDLVSKIIKNVTVKMPKTGLQINYLGTGAVEANLGKNNIYLYLISNVATNSPTIQGYWRFRYYG